MELRHLRYFIAIAEERSFTGAAERLWIAQPGLSTQMRRLEAELGVQLFDRHPRGIELTQAGELFLGQLNRTIDAYLPAYIVGDTLGGHTCRPGAAACPLPAWAGMSVLAAYAAAALLIGGCILAWRDA